MIELTKQLGEKFKNARLATGKSQEDLGLDSGVHKTFIGKIEKGAGRVNFESLQKLGRYLGLPSY